MPISKKQLVRMVRLVAQLKENRYPNCISFSEEMRKADLNENLNIACTARTIFRDIQTLKDDFSAPIAFDFKRNGYYLTNHKWNFSCPQIFDDSGMLSAVLGARVAEHIFPASMKRQIRDAVDFLLTNNNPDFLDTAQVDSLVVIPSNKAVIAPSVFMPLFYAWQNHLLCKIQYGDSKGNSTEREFEPHALVFFEGVWYTKGFCRLRQEPRTLVVSRMKSVVPLEISFEPDPKLIRSANEEDIFDPETVENVIVHCDSYLAGIIQTRPLHLKQKIKHLPDGSCELHVAKMSKYRLITWIMHQCGRATIFAPIDLSMEVSNFAGQIMEFHKLVVQEKFSQGGRK